MDLLDQSYPGPENFNVAPTSNIWVIYSNRNDDGSCATMEARWWLTPNWAKEISTKYAMFNARTENLEKSPAFKTPFKRKRCVVPIAGYYEWQRLQEGKRPHYVKSVENEALLLAGLWDEWLNPDLDQLLNSFTIVTCEVVEPMKFLHHRQPVMLARNEVATWLQPDTTIGSLHDLIKPSLPHALEIVPVSNFVGNTRNNGPECIRPVGESRRIVPLS